MSSLKPSLAAEIIAASQAGCAEAAAALTTALDGPIKLGAVEAGQYSASQVDDALAGPGLLVLLTVGGAGLAMVLPESSGLLPEWLAAPEETGRNKLASLAQELSRRLLPATLAIQSFRAERVASLAASLGRGGAAAEAASVSIQATRDDAKSQLTLIWPLPAPQDVFDEDEAGSTTGAGGRSAAPRSLAQLPGFSRSLLKVRLPVSIHLANKRECIQEIVEIVPGSIIKFDKGCDELLHMVVGGQPVAEGEAVKIGDKFGFRVTAMLLPREHFVKVKRPRAG